MHQMTLGLQWLSETFGVRPRYAWHIGIWLVMQLTASGSFSDRLWCAGTDPFGHSAFTATLYSLLGYSAWVMNRIDDTIKAVCMH